jgi:hypothetical protein
VRIEQRIAESRMGVPGYGGHLRQHSSTRQSSAKTTPPAGISHHTTSQRPFASFHQLILTFEKLHQR